MKATMFGVLRNQIDLLTCFVVENWLVLRPFVCFPGNDYGHHDCRVPPEDKRNTLGIPFSPVFYGAGHQILIVPDIPVETYRNRRLTHSPVPNVTVQSVEKIQPETSRVTIAVAVSIYTSGTTLSFIKAFLASHWPYINSPSRLFLVGMPVTKLPRRHSGSPQNLMMNKSRHFTRAAAGKQIYYYIVKLYVIPKLYYIDLTRSLPISSWSLSMPQSTVGGLFSRRRDSVLESLFLLSLLCRPWYVRFL